MKCDVPFRLVGGAQPLAVVSVKLNEPGPFDFAVDTGAARRCSCRSSRTAEPPIDEKKEAAGAGGRLQVGLAKVENFSVGEASRSDVPVIVTSDIERIAAAVGSTTDGVIGYEFLRHFRLTVDYRRLVLGLEDGPSIHPEDGARHAGGVPATARPPREAADRGADEGQRHGTAACSPWIPGASVTCDRQRSRSPT